MAVAKKHMKTAHHVKDLNLAPKGQGAHRVGGEGRCRCSPASASGSPRRSRCAASRISACLHVTTETAQPHADAAGGRRGPRALRLATRSPRRTTWRPRWWRLRHLRLRHQGRGQRHLLQAHQRRARPRAATRPWTTAATSSRACITRPHASCWTNIVGGTEETTTGVIRLRAMEKDGVLKLPGDRGQRRRSPSTFRQPLRHRPEHHRRHHPRHQPPARRQDVVVVLATAGAAAASPCARKGMGADVVVTEIDPLQGARGRHGRLPGDADGGGGEGRRHLLHRHRQHQRARRRSTSRR